MMLITRGAHQRHNVGSVAAAEKGSKLFKKGVGYGFFGQRMLITGGDFKNIQDYNVLNGKSG